MLSRALQVAALVALGSHGIEGWAPPASPQDPAPEDCLPAFRFRAMDHRTVPVKLNGQRLSTTPCLWSITRTLEFDPRIPVPVWPPDRAVLVGSTQRSDLPDSQAELYVATGDRLATPANGLLPNDCVLFVNGSIRGKALRGALRLRVEGYRWIDYTPLEDSGEEHSLLLARTLWFERTPDE